MHKPSSTAVVIFSTPECSEEESLLSDLLRRHPELDTVLFDRCRALASQPLHGGRDSSAEECSAESHRRLTHLGTGLRQESRVALNWPAGLNIGRGLPSVIGGKIARVWGLGCSDAAGWRWSVRRIHGELELPVQLSRSPNLSIDSGHRGLHLSACW